MESNASIKKSITGNQWLLLMIVLIGAVLRFYDYFNLPYSHDEISALLRTDFKSLGEVLEHGVKLNDFHPAGVQVFLYYWTMLFGNAAWIVKLPFTLMSIASIYLVYRVTKQLHNETVGLIVAGIMATSQYFIVYGSYARPYASGLLFCLLLIASLLNMIQHPEQKFWRNWLLFIAAGALCAYNHYFSALVAGLIGVIGVFFISRKNLKFYALAGILIGLLFLPHLSITLHQLDKGGVGGEQGWLGAPTSDFFGHYFGYLVHFSWISAFGLLLIFIYGFLNSSFSRRYFLLFFIAALLFLFPLLLGYFYSIYVNPVLQFSVLIFSCFFLLIAVFGHFKVLNIKQNMAILAVIVGANCYALIFQREHFDLYYNSIYEKINSDFLEARQESKSASTIKTSISSLVAYPTSMEKFYSSTKSDFVAQKQLSSFASPILVAKYLDSVSRSSDYFFLGTSNEIPINLIPQIQKYYPNLVWERNYMGGSTYLFSNLGRSSTGTLRFQLSQTDAQLKKQGYMVLDSLHEFSPTLAFQFEKILKNKRNFIDISALLDDTHPDDEVLIVTEVRDKDTIYQWSASSTKDQVWKNGRAQIFHSVELLSLSHYENCYLNVYLWNKNKTEITYRELKIVERWKNPVLYGLFEPIVR